MVQGSGSGSNISVFNLGGPPSHEATADLRDFSFVSAKSAFGGQALGRTAADSAILYPILEEKSTKKGKGIPRINTN